MNQLREDKRGIWGDALVNFKDGGKIKIKEIVREKIKGEVLTLNENTGAVEYKNIIGWFNNGTIKNKADWINIQAEGLGQKNDEKNGVVSITLTPTHKLLTKRGWLEAYLLSLDDYLVGSYMSLQGEMKDILYAIATGDSHLYANSKNSKNTASLILNDSKNPEYVKWKIDKLSRVLTFHQSSLGMKSEYTHDLKLLKDEVSKFQIASSRSPLPFLEQHFSLLGLAILIMDDGHLDKQGSYILSFGRLAKHKGVLGITSWLFNKWGYENSMNKEGSLRFYKKASRKIAAEICYFVPKCMEYKLPEDLRNKYKEFDLNFSFKLLPKYIKIKLIRIASDRQMNKMRGKYSLQIARSRNYMVGNHSKGVIVKDSN